ncbi:hypothetical protein CB0940_06230 [Cercospora beticola]|uniref:BTB domain-containing protein n=1 Tax=Cercospora beticola TaxID=122368 RepID=A0A2G5I1R0_CERBT|nr:hypothetical protein CB0940_06230 [Cercospora beticola]PIA98463.1 hypothetical protein CB0940_06230 [Cercospora beticola]WPA98845.1 hypothetical protein RHO25_003458 [Cercospora beticola]CAK1360128.1 unnamed protein product [Cercospora beticola]
MADSVVDIDPDGDVVLVCGSADKTKRLRVSSKVLSLASPVFKTMLGPDFKEGKRLSKHGSLNLPLPDDDGEDMTIICNILHFRHSKLPRQLDTIKLQDISVLADKYSCTMALGPIVEHWVEELRKDCSDAVRVILICASFRLHLPLMFGELGREHILRYNGKCTLVGDRPEQEVLQKLFDAMNVEALNARGKIAKFVDTMMVMHCDTDSTHGSNCPRALDYVVGFLRTLRRAELWPMHTTSDHTLESLLSKMRSVNWQQVELSTRTCGHSSWTDTCFCSSGMSSTNPTLNGIFTSRADKIVKEIPELCLGCALEGATWKKADCDHPQGSSSPFGI